MPTTSPTDASRRRPESPGAVFQVSELVQTLKHGLEMSFPSVWVEGEVSGFVAARSGHWYFSLKDNDAQIRCAFFRHQNLRSIRPSEGQRCLIRARATLFVARGELQLVVDSLEDAGLGALHLAFEALKRKLDAEGLFATERKRKIPPAPRCIGVLSSPAGAAIHDVLTTLRRRNPLCRVILYPIPVQGEDAPRQIHAMLLRALRRRECDVLLITRGGGSAEDLQAFNDETLARSIAAAELPIVSAIGHEVDFSICDLVADLRAATPTAAAELLSPDRTADARELARLRLRLGAALRQATQSRRRELQHWQHRLSNQSPQRRLQEREQLLDALNARLEHALGRLLRSGGQHLNALHGRLHAQDPARRLGGQRKMLDELRLRLQRAVQQTSTQAGARFSHAMHRLHNLAPQRILERGYSITWHGSDIVREAPQEPGQTLRIQLASGEIRVHVCEPD